MIVQKQEIAGTDVLGTYSPHRTVVAILIRNIPREPALKPRLTRDKEADVPAKSCCWECVQGFVVSLVPRGQLI